MLIARENRPRRAHQHGITGRHPRYCAGALGGNVEVSGHQSAESQDHRGNRSATRPKLENGGRTGRHARAAHRPDGSAHLAVRRAHAPASERTRRGSSSAGAKTNQHTRGKSTHAPHPGIGFVIRAFLIALAIAHGAAAQTAPTVVISFPCRNSRFFDNNGKPLAGGCVATYLRRAYDDAVAVTFTDATGMVPNPKPGHARRVETRAAIWINVNAIKYVVKAKSTACSLSAGTVLSTQPDNVQDSGMPGFVPDLYAAPGGAGNLGYQAAGRHCADHDCGRDRRDRGFGSRL